jgi:CheY-like chemotaxis protein
MRLLKIAPQDRESPLVLLVEDDEGIREALADFLEEEGFRVASARNGLEAVKFIAESDTPPALIMLDLMIPFMDGWTFCKVRQATTKLRSIPVLALSATPMAGSHGWQSA